MVILGRAYGLTNIIVTDRMGRTIFQQEVNVAAAASGRVSLYRGTLVNNFACAPHCERTPMPGPDVPGIPLKVGERSRRRPEEVGKTSVALEYVAAPAGRH